MKKILILISLITIFLIIGCETEPPEPRPVQAPLPELPEEISYHIGDTIEVGGEQFTIKDITQKGELILINDREIQLKGTNNPAKINNQEISISKLNINIDSSQRSVELNIQNFDLAENEYVIEYNEEIEIKEKKVKLIDVHTDKLDTISIKVIHGLNSETKRINKGKTENILDLQITNIRSYPRAISYEKYAVIQAEE